MLVDIITIFPPFFDSPLRCGILSIAQKKGVVRFRFFNPRDFADDERGTIDDRPYGGGPGMVMMPEPIFRAVESADASAELPARRILLTPQGKLLDQRLARELARQHRLLIICGHYEGVDERVPIGLGTEEISVGNYILSGGETACLVLLDTITRLLPGAVGDLSSTLNESFESGLLEYPQYTRPPEFRGMRVPEVLLSGDHEAVARWRLAQSIKRTVSRRPDLLRKEKDNDKERTRSG